MGLNAMAFALSGSEGAATVREWACNHSLTLAAPSRAIATVLIRARGVERMSRTFVTRFAAAASVVLLLLAPVARAAADLRDVPSRHYILLTDLDDALS
jgi:hypothetical protein